MKIERINTCVSANKRFLLQIPSRSVLCMLLFNFIWNQLDGQIPQRKQIAFFNRGDEYDLALAGGIDNAQVSQGDIDRDGHHDLLVFDRTGDVILPFIWQPTFKKYRLGFEYRDQFPVVRDWALFVDFNKDGIPDIFSSARNTLAIQGIEVNEGYLDNGKLKFKLKKSQFKNVIPILINGNYTQIAVDNTDIPAFDDVDADGDLDILLFENGNNRVTWFKNIAIERGLPLDSLIYTYHDRCYGRFIESGLSNEITLSSTPDTCAGFRGNIITARHAGSTLASIDLNGDGLKDLLIGDLESPNLTALYNGGTKDLAWMTKKETTWPIQDFPVNMRRFLAPFVVDVDHDGKLDVLVSPNARNFLNFNNLWYYKNISNTNIPEYEYVQSNFLTGEMIDLGSGAAPCFLDYNQDGLIDLLIGTEGFYDTQFRQARLFLYENKGTKTQPAFHLVNEDYLQFSKYSNLVVDARINFTPSIGDMDQDNDFDLLIGDNGGEFFYCENIAGEGKTFEFDVPKPYYQTLGAFGNSAPALADLNRDGLLDILTGTRLLLNDDNNQICGSFIYFQNQGSKGNPFFEPDFGKLPNSQCVGSAIINGFVSKIYTTPAIFDFRGKYKIFSGTFLGQIKVFTDIENNIYNKFTEEHFDFGNTKEGERTAISVADIDDDGILDMVIGNQRGGISIWSTNYKLDGSVKVAEVGRVDEIFNVYPQPFSDLLVIENKSNDVCRATVSSINGQVLHRLSLSDGINVLPAKNLLPGLYYLQVNSPKIQYNKIIIKK